MTTSANTDHTLLQKAAEFYAQGNIAQAGALANQVFAKNPDDPQALYILGMVSNALGRDELAATLIGKAIAIQPDQPYFYFHLASIRQGQGKLAEAEAAYLNALRLKPDFAEVYLNLGTIRFGQGMAAAAKREFDIALHWDPKNSTALYNLAVLAQQEGEHIQALVFLQKALKYNPESANVHMARAFSLLMTEQFQDGWQEYEWRWRLANLSPRICPKPRWQPGVSPAGKILYIYTEQGFGDAIMFGRYLPLLQEMGGKIHLECKPELLRLFQDAHMADQVVARQPGDENPPPFDYDLHLPLLSLPQFFTTSTQSIPARIPYLKVAPERVAYWRERLGRGGSLKVGLSWSGNPEASANHGRACKLEDLLPMTRITGVRFFSVQKGHPAEELLSLTYPHGIENLELELTDFAETAALMVNLDLLISTDTAVVHLAGALGVPVWTLLHTSAEWRWLQHREDSPWYPSMRLFRQKSPGNWAELVERVQTALMQKVETLTPN